MQLLAKGTPRVSRALHDEPQDWYQQTGPDARRSETPEELCERPAERPRPWIPAEQIVTLISLNEVAG